MKEADLQRAIVKKLLRPYKEQGLLHFHVGMEGVKLKPYQAQQAKAQGMERGCPDMRLFFPDSRVCFIELKKKGNYLTEEQRQVSGLLNGFGFDWHTVTAKDPEDAVRQVSLIVDQYI